jgi:transposase
MHTLIGLAWVVIGICLLLGERWALMVGIYRRHPSASTRWRKARARAEKLAPTLLAVPGCGPLTSAKIIGNTAGVNLFESRDAYARHNGTAPRPVRSGAVGHLHVE